MDKAIAKSDSVKNTSLPNHRNRQNVVNVDCIYYNVGNDTEIPLVSAVADSSDESQVYANVPRGVHSGRPAKAAPGDVGDGTHTYESLGARDRTQESENSADANLYSSLAVQG